MRKVKLSIIKRFIYISICGFLIVFLIRTVVGRISTPPINSHNCRFWGIVFSEPDPFLEIIIRAHLDSLKSLGNTNPDGWAIGYYLSPDSEAILPVVSRGEPGAPLDPRYTKAVGELTKYIKTSGIAHVRKGTSGPTGIPNPHPFSRKTINRDFNMLFAHNGAILTDVLLNLIRSMNPTYLDSNPPDYAPNYLDSDLFFIYILEAIDTYYFSSIETCIATAVTKLDSALGSNSAQLNFVMSDGTTLWALRFAETATGYYTVYYYPDAGISNFWVAASEPLDTLATFWSVVPNSTLVTLMPNRLPKFTPIYGPADTISQAFGYEDFWLNPNPFCRDTKITYRIINASWVNIRIYNIAGCLVRNLVEKKQPPGSYTITWDGKDNQGNNLPAGIYFCKFNEENNCDNEKIVLIR